MEETAYGPDSLQCTNRGKQVRAFNRQLREIKKRLDQRPNFHDIAELLSSLTRPDYGLDGPTRQRLNNLAAAVEDLRRWDESGGPVKD